MAKLNPFESACSFCKKVVNTFQATYGVALTAHREKDSRKECDGSGELAPVKDGPKQEK